MTAACVRRLPLINVDSRSVLDLLVVLAADCAKKKPGGGSSMFS